MNWIKSLLVNLYWSPRTFKALMKVQLGRYFVLRNEPTEFLHYLEFAFKNTVPSKGNQKLLGDLKEQLDDELRARNRQPQGV